MRLGNLLDRALLSPILIQSRSGDRSCKFANIRTLRAGLAPAAHERYECTYERTAHNHRTNKQPARECIFPQFDNVDAHFTNRIKHHGGEGQHSQHHRAGNSAWPHRPLSFGGDQSFAIAMPKRLFRRALSHARASGRHCRRAPASSRAHSGAGQNLTTSYSIASNSTSNTSVAPGGIAGGEPASP